MFKIISVAVTLVCALPVLANSAWFLNTQARSAGGAITSRNMTNQRSTSGSIFRSYMTSARTSVTRMCQDIGYP
jgi:hypothetical protein